MTDGTPARDRTIDPERLADFLERHGDAVLAAIVYGLRKVERAERRATVDAEENARPPPARLDWRRVGLLDGFEHIWPDVHEHYGPMTLWEARHGRAPVQFAVGEPRERTLVYGRTRGWVSVWEVVNGHPRELRAHFVETDDFAATGHRIARIRGKGGNRKAGFKPGEQHLMATVYADMRVEVIRDRCRGPYAPNRLGVVVADSDTDVMLSHALAHRSLA